MSKFKMPFRVTPATTGISTMSVANAMPSTMEKAPYLFTAVLSGYMDQETLDSKVVTKSKGDLNLADQRLVWDMGMTVIAEAVAQNIKVETDIFTAQAAVAGSVPYSNSQPTAANEVYVSVMPTKYFRDMTEKIPYADSATDTPFSVRTINEPAASGSAPEPGNVTAGNTAYLCGSDFTGDITVAFVNNETGASTPATVTDVLSTVATLTVPAIPAGVYTLEVTCLGKGTVRTMKRGPKTVNVAAAEVQPSITLIKEQGNEADNTAEFIGDAPVTIHGTCLSGVTKSDIKLRLTARASSEVLANEAITSDVASATDTAVTLSAGLAPVNRTLEDEVWAGAENRAEVVVTIDGNEYAKEVTFTL